MILTQFSLAGDIVFKPACSFGYKYKAMSIFSTTEVKICLIGGFKEKFLGFHFQYPCCATWSSLQSRSGLKVSIAASCCVLETASWQ